VPTQTELLIEIRDLLAGRNETATTDAVVDTDATEAQRRVAEMVHER
jgi:large conductance mechanosensitive channel